MELNGNQLGWSMQSSSSLASTSGLYVEPQRMSYDAMGHLDIKPDMSQLPPHNMMPVQPNRYYQHEQYNPMMQSPTSSMGSPGGYHVMTNPASMHSSHNMMGGFPKHICQICGDRASGKHYGVYSCEGCKGFFKRTVRKELSYSCRDDRNCIIDKRQRNRCQYCRYMKCLNQGMKREAVQEERQRNREKGLEEPDSTIINPICEMPVEKILEAEQAVELKRDNYIEANDDAIANICQAADKQLFSLVEWARRIPHFVDLPVDDQVRLLRSGWNELLIAAFSHRSIPTEDGILLATGLRVHRNAAHKAGVGTIFDRVLNEVVGKMREMKMDQIELGCLRAIVLFNPEAKDLTCAEEVEALRELVYATLEDYTRKTYSSDCGRFAKLMLRLPALRSIGLKAVEHLFFFKLVGDTPIDTFLLEMLENPTQLMN